MYENYSASEFQNAINNDENAVILDVRTAMEYAEGAIPGAVNLDFMSGTFSERIQELDKDKNYYLYCRSGARSGAACSVLDKSGFKKVGNLRDGILSWTGKLKRA